MLKPFAEEGRSELAKSDASPGAEERLSRPNMAIKIIGQHHRRQHFRGGSLRVSGLVLMSLFGAALAVGLHRRLSSFESFLGGESLIDQIVVKHQHADDR